MPKDLEHSTVEVRYVKGYPSLAAFIASDRDKSTAIYRRFDRLSARNLLYLQSELIELEARQDALDLEDLEATTEDKKSTRDWQVFKTRASKENNVREKDRMAVVKEIREKMKEYSTFSSLSLERPRPDSIGLGEAIVLESTLLSLKPPSSRTLEAFRNVFHNVKGSGDSFPTLGGYSASILDDVGDLITLRAQADEDRLTTFLRYFFPLLFTVGLSPGQERKNLTAIPC